HRAAAWVAAFIMAEPPLACTVSMLAPSAPAAATAADTVLGISWNFKSRKTLGPPATILRTSVGPSAVKSCLPTLKVETESPSAEMMWRASAAVATSRATIRRSRTASIRIQYRSGKLAKRPTSAKSAQMWGTDASITGEVTRLIDLLGAERGGYGFGAGYIQPYLLQAVGT